MFCGKNPKFDKKTSPNNRIQKRNHAQNQLTTINNPFLGLMQAMSSMFAPTATQPAQDSCSLVRYQPKQSENLSSKVFAYKLTSKSPYVKYEDAPRLIEDNMNVDKLPDLFKYDTSAPNVKNLFTILASGSYDISFQKRKDKKAIE
jgi:hypothetical protein